MYRLRLLSPNIQAASLAVVQLELRCGTVTLGFGTGFLDEVDGRPFLITNWHNVTGRNPASGKVIASDGITPDSVCIRVSRWANPEVNFAKPMILTFPIEYRNLNQWRMHPEGQRIDVVALELSKCDLDGGIRAYVSGILSHHDAVAQIGSGVFVVGFPQALRPTGTLPLWKSGTIATEPSVKADDEPCFWIDAITQRGMSGSPVFVTMPGVARSDFDAPKIGFETVVVASTHLGFAGIYSGRMNELKPGPNGRIIENGSKNFEAQLGKVWRPECVGDVILNGIPLDYVEM